MNNTEPHDLAPDGDVDGLSAPPAPDDAPADHLDADSAPDVAPPDPVEAARLEAEAEGGAWDAPAPDGFLSVDGDMIRAGAIDVVGPSDAHGRTAVILRCGRTITVTASQAELAALIVRGFAAAERRKVNSFARLAGQLREVVADLFAPPGQPLAPGQPPAGPSFPVGARPLPGDELGWWVQRGLPRPDGMVPAGAELRETEDRRVEAVDAQGLVWAVFIATEQALRTGKALENDVCGYIPLEYIWHQGEGGDGFWGPPPAPSKPPTA